MKTNYFYSKNVTAVLLLAAFFAITSLAYSTNYYSIGGNWNNSATWSAVCGGAGGAGIPGMADDVTICSGTTVTLTANRSVGQLTIESGATLNNGGSSLTIQTGGGTYRVDGTHAGIGDIILNSTSHYISGKGAITNTGKLRNMWTCSVIIQDSANLTLNCAITGNPGQPTGLQIAPGSTVNVVDASVTLENGYGLADAYNYGTLSITGGDLNLLNGQPFYNYGTLRVTGTGMGGNINILDYISEFYNYGVATVSGNIWGNSSWPGNSESNWLNAAGSVLNVGGEFFPPGNPGDLYVTGTTFIQSNFISPVTQPNTVNYNGSGNQDIKIPYDLPETYSNIILSNSGIKTLTGNITINGNLTIKDNAQLDVSANNYSITMKGNPSVGLAGNWTDTSAHTNPFEERTGTVTFSGISTQTITATPVSGGETFYNLIVNKTADSLLVFNDSITVSNNISLVSGIVALNKKILTIDNPNTTAVAGGSTTAYIQSEDLSGNNQSRVQWNIKDSTGYYNVPFGLNKGGTDYYIPFVFNIATKGFETTTGTGNISISTYSTPTTNTPYPVSPNPVSQVYNPANAVDRFWQIDVSNYTLNPTANLTFNYADPEKPVAGDTLVAQRWNATTALWDVPAGGQIYLASTPTVSGLVVVSGVNTFSPWTLARKTNYLECPPIALTTNTSLCYGIQQNLSADTDPDNFYNLVWSPTTGLSSTTGYNVIATLDVSVITYTLSGTETGNCYDNKTVTLDVKPLPTLTGTGNTSVCYALAAPLSATGGISYTWNPATYLSSPTNNNVMFSQAPPGTQSYTVTGYNEFGCTDRHALTVTVHPSPTVNITPIQPVCFGDTVTLNATGTGGDYAWLPNAYFTGNTGDAVKAVFPVAAGSYTCNVTLTDANNCSGSDTLVAMVVTALIANAGEDVSLVCGTTATLSGSGGEIYFWSPLAGLSSSGSSSTQFNLSTPGVYTYSLVVASNIGCESAPDEVIITVANITANAGTDQSICTGSSADLNGTGGQTYTWWPETGLSSSGSSSTQFNLSTPGAYTYSLTASSGIGCESTDSVSITVMAFPTVNAGADVTVRPNSMNSLDTLNVSGNAALYSWNPNVCSNCLSVVVAPTATTEYIITAGNGVCSVSDTVVVFYVPYECNIFVPNAFSPNGDFQNDSIKVNSYCILPEGFAFRIFDRWGTMVFQTYTQNKAWDGKYENRDIASGTVFVYTINGTNINNDAINEKGNITLVR